MSVITGCPSEDIPAAVCDMVGAAMWRLVWRNELNGLTFEISRPIGRQFLKWMPAASGIDLADEAVRLQWAGAFWAVPQMLDYGGDDTGSWLLTQGLAGANAVADHWLASPAAAVEAIGSGLRGLHDALPVSQCPFTWSAQDRTADAQRRAQKGLLAPGSWHQVHQRLGVAEALELAADVPPVDQPVVCHGDACAPNTLISPTGHVTGHVDLGSLGLADRWADLAIATWSAEWNYGPGWEKPLLDAYGIADDPERTAYYRLLWDLGP